MEEATPIGLERRRWKRLLIPAAWILVSHILVVVFLLAFFDVRCVGDLWAYRCMTEGPLHPLWKDLALRRIHKGSDLAQIIRKHPPMKQEVWEPYAVFSYCEAGETANTLRVVATRGVLVCADASGFWRVGSRWARWDYIFFSDPTHIQPFEEARRRYLDQICLEEQAWRIHRAIAAGQDVFLSSRVERIEADSPPISGADAEMIRQYEQIYGKEMARQMGFAATIELTVEVTQSLSGDLEPGTFLTFPSRDCNETDLAEPEAVFLHVDDWGAILPGSNGRTLSDGSQTGPRMVSIADRGRNQGFRDPLPVPNGPIKWYSREPPGTLGV